MQVAALHVVMQAGIIMILNHVVPAAILGKLTFGIIGKKQKSS